MAPSLIHPSLHAVLEGVEVKLDNTTVVHYRGIQYARIPRRFAKAELVDSWDNEKLDCRYFG